MPVRYGHLAVIVQYVWIVAVLERVRGIRRVVVPIRVVIWVEVVGRIQVVWIVVTWVGAVVRIRVVWVSEVVRTGVVSAVGTIVTVSIVRIVWVPIARSVHVTANPLAITIVAPALRHHWV